MLVTALILMWLATSAASFAIFVDSWRESFDATRADMALFVLLSALGPVSLGAAIIVWLIEQPSSSASPVIWGRK